MDMKKQLIELLEIHGVSGNEKPVREYLVPILTDIMDEVMVDEYGNLIGALSVGTGAGTVILLSAHMDTVKGVREDKILVESSGIVRAELPDGSKGILGADDRAGIAIALEVLRSIPESFNGVIKIAFSREEEIGCVGVEHIDTSFLDDVDLAIVIDRRGNRDIVVGGDMAFCSDAVGEFVEHVSKLNNMDWQCVQGGMSDAVSFASRGVNTINLSAGFQNEHTVNEFVSIPNMKDTARLITQMLGAVYFHTLEFGVVPNGNKWINQNRTRHQYREYYFDEHETIWEEMEDENGHVYTYTIGNDVVIKQGNHEVKMETNNFLELYDKVLNSLAKR